MKKLFLAMALLSMSLESLIEERGVKKKKRAHQIRSDGSNSAKKFFIKNSFSQKNEMK